MSLCKYARLVDKRWEFGTMRCTIDKKGKELWAYDPLGEADSYEAALTANAMVLEGAPRKGFNHIGPTGRIAF